MDPLHAFDVPALVMALQAHHDFQSLVIRLLVGCHQGPKSRRVDAQRLFHEHVLAGLDRRRVLGGAKAGRSGQDDQLDVARDGLLVSIQPGELPLDRDVDSVAVLALEDVQRAVDTVLKRVGDRHNPDGRIRVEAIGRCPGARPPQPTTATRIWSLPTA